MASKGKGYERRAARIALEEQPKRERMKLRGGGRKHLNEHLSPLRRYLASQVGKPWDKIFADVCRYVDRSSAVQDHVRDHIEDYVGTHVYAENGKLYHASGRAIGRPLYTLFYVCPRSRLLRATPGLRRSAYGDHLERLHIRLLGGGNALIRYEGAWHLVTFDRFPKDAFTWGMGYPVQVRHWDALLKVELYRGWAIQRYGQAIHVTSTRRASKREVRRWVNTYPYANRV